MASNGGRADNGIALTSSNIALTEKPAIAFTKTKRSTLEKCLMIVSAILLLAAITFLVAFVVYYEKTEELQNVCTTEECVMAASRLSSVMDASVNPCDNFYDFACGSWMKKNVIPEDRSSLDMFGVLQDEVLVTLKNLLETERENEIDSVKKVKALYASCINETRLEERGADPAVQFLVTLGGWPMINSSWKVDDFDLEGLLIHLRRYNNAPIISMSVGTDLKNSSRRILYVDQADFGMLGQKYYQRGRDDVMLLAYEKLIINIASELGNHVADVAADVKDIVDFEIMLANISVPAEERRDSEDLYNMYNISQLATSYPKFDWLRYFQELMNMTEVELEVKEGEPVINRSPRYFEKLMELLETTSNRTLANYIVWRIMMNRAHNLNEKYRDFFQEYDEVIYGTSTSRARFRTCAAYVVNNVGRAVGRMFVDATFDEASKTNADEMITNLRASFKSLLDELDWMDGATKAVARDKADAINPKIGYPNDILNNTLLNMLYENNTYDPLKYFENVLQNIQRSTINNLKTLRQRVDRNVWTTAPSTVNAYYNSLTNQIMFPAGILQPPFYSKTYHKSLNYGGIGVVIGHEITHGFDDRGRQYDKNGNLVQWWSDDAIGKFKSKSQCIIDQYSQYSVPEADMKINGINTQGENIADNGGVKQSYRAYRKWVEEQGKEEQLLPGLKYNNNQLFFISFAQIWCSNMRRENAINRILTGVHSPGRFRVIGTMQNSQDFSDAFSCARTSYMNPEKKCHVW
ncbi:neprilysin-like [Haliotis rubra]|uniref:neprilysin-like n=1 Tax=Haliotis rubra TaxID=36100 RepID=UPI001EE5B4D1|nr:neprilysin-like [Haliotis rubra]